MLIGLVRPNAPMLIWSGSSCRKYNENASTVDTMSIRVTNRVGLQCRINDGRLLAEAGQWGIGRYVLRFGESATCELKEGRPHTRGDNDFTVRIRNHFESGVKVRAVRSNEYNENALTADTMSIKVTNSMRSTKTVSYANMGEQLHVR